jgi:hypothetical protein
MALGPLKGLLLHSFQGVFFGMIKDLFLTFDFNLRIFNRAIFNLRNYFAHNLAPEKEALSCY